MFSYNPSNSNNRKTAAACSQLSREQLSLRFPFLLSSFWYLFFPFLPDFTTSSFFHSPPSFFAVEKIRMPCPKSLLPDIRIASHVVSNASCQTLTDRLTKQIRKISLTFNVLNFYDSSQKTGRHREGAKEEKKMSKDAKMRRDRDGK